MITFNKILGNINSKEWSDKLSKSHIDFIELDQWSAQKSRMIIQGESERYGISLDRHTHLNNGDILEYNPDNNSAIVVHINLTQVMVINLSKVAEKGQDRLIQTCVEIGHAIGNQHWPAVVKGDKIYVPLTLDRRVMECVMNTHNFQDIEYKFQNGEEVIPFLSPHDIRYLFSRTVEQCHHDHHH